MTQTATDDTARWNEWQRANRESSRRSEVHARIFACLMMVGVAGWLALALVG